MQPDSDLVTMQRASLGYRRGRYDERREYGGIVVHITGSGPLDRYTRGWRPEWAGLSQRSTLLDVALAVYGGIMEAGPHYLVSGAEVAQLCPESLAAWHVGSDGAEVYEDASWPAQADEDVAWWGHRWPQLSSPLELAGGRLWGPDRSANGGAVGIEVLHPHDETRSPWTPETLRTLGRLLRDICSRRGIPRRADYVVGHSDAHPVARTSHGAAWDPPSSLWSLDVAADLLEVPRACMTV